MEKKFSIENLKLALMVILTFVGIGDKMGSENNWSSRMSHLFGFLPSLMTLGSIKWDMIDDEIKDIDEDEKKELIVFIKEKFDIADDNLEKVIEEGLEIIIEVGSFVKTIKGFISKVKVFFK